MVTLKFLDTYALVAFVEGKLEFDEQEDYITLNINLAELFMALLRIYDEKTARHFHTIFQSIAESFPRELIPKAMLWKKKHSKKRFSYADALGYALAQEKSCDFVTGDKEFKGMKGVQYLNA